MVLFTLGGIFLAEKLTFEKKSASANPVNISLAYGYTLASHWPEGVRRRVVINVNEPKDACISEQRGDEYLLIVV